MTIKLAATSIVLPVHRRMWGGEPEFCAGRSPIPWPSSLRWAMNYVIRQSQDGVRLAEWINTCDLNLWTGCTRADLGVALTYARRWRPEGFAEGELPPVQTPAGLFG